MADKKTKNCLVVKGSFVEITGGKYAGYYADVIGFTATGQCRIQLDHGRKCQPGAVPTKNMKTRCLRRHVEVVEVATGASSTTLVGSSPLLDETDSQLILLARLVALKLKDQDPELNLASFVSTVRNLLRCEGN
jgi:hypothetical protein